MNQLIILPTETILVSDEKVKKQDELCYSEKPVFGSGGQDNVVFNFDERIEYQTDFGHDLTLLKVVASSNPERNRPLISQENIDNCLKERERRKIEEKCAFTNLATGSKGARNEGYVFYKEGFIDAYYLIQSEQQDKKFTTRQMEDVVTLALTSAPDILETKGFDNILGKVEAILRTILHETQKYECKIEEIDTYWTGEKSVKLYNYYKEPKLTGGYITITKIL